MHSKFSNFKRINILDTCAILNVTSSKTMSSIAIANGFCFCCTQFVHYECMHKPRTTEITPEQKALSEIIADLLNRKKILVYNSLGIEHLNDIDILESRKRLGKGELSSIAFAKTIRHAFMTDDQGARRLANETLGEEYVQTTPQLFAFLFVQGYLIDSHKDDIIREHSSFKRPLGPHFEKAYLIAMEYKLKMGGGGEKGQP